MIPAVTAVSVYALGEVPAAIDQSTPNAVRALVSDPESELVFVLVARPSQLPGGTINWPYALATHALGEIDPADAVSEASAVYLSDRGWTTEPDEVPASTPMPPRLAQPLNYEARVPLPGQQMGRGTASVGEIRLNNSDGGLDYLLDYAWAGRAIEIKLGGTLQPGKAGERRLSFSEFATVFKGRAESVFADEDYISITVRDPATRLEVMVETDTYAGTGGLEGGDDLEGRFKPRLYGVKRKVQAPMVVRSELLFQLNNGPIQAVLAAYAKGVALTYAGDYATVAELRAATQGASGSGADIEAGEYATCKAEGYARLGGEPLGNVTWDVQGDASGSGYVETAPEIIRRLATTRAQPVYEDPAEIDAPAFAALAGGAAVGVWSGPEGRTIADMCSELMDAIGGWWVHARDGRLSVGVLDAPGTAVAEHDTYITGTLEELPAPQPAWRQRLGYRKYELVQDESALADSLSAEDVAGLGQSHRFVQASNESLRTIFPSARDAEHLTCIDTESDAQTEVDRRQKRDRKRRRLYRYAIARPLFQYQVGQTHRTAFAALGLSGRDGVLVALSEDAANRRCTLELLG